MLTNQNGAKKIPFELASKRTETKLAWDINFQYLDEEKSQRPGWYPG